MPERKGITLKINVKLICKSSETWTHLIFIIKALTERVQRFRHKHKSRLPNLRETSSDLQMIITKAKETKTKQVGKHPQGEFKHGSSEDNNGPAATILPGTQQGK